MRHQGIRKSWLEIQKTQNDVILHDSNKVEMRDSEDLLKSDVILYDYSHNTSWFFQQGIG